jgi:hypothetical protein
MNGEMSTASMSAPPDGANDYVLCGWHVRSEIPLPEVMQWAGGDHAPDVTVRLGRVPPSRGPVVKGSPARIGPDGECRLEFASARRFLVVAGGEITVETEGPVDAPDLHALLLGPVLGVLCHQRALFPLHAACVRLGNGAFALAGRTGVGKSTLATALVRRGHCLVADDVTAIELIGSGPPRVRPSFPRLRLWEDAMRALDISGQGVPRADTGKGKFHFVQPGRFDPLPVELRGIYLLAPATETNRDIAPVTGAAAAATLCDEIYRRRIGVQLGRKSELLTQAFHVAAQVPLFRCPVVSDLARVGGVAERIAAHFASLGADAQAPA